MTKQNPKSTMNGFIWLTLKNGQNPTINNLQVLLKCVYLFAIELNYRHGTLVFVDWLKLDPLFMVFSNLCSNKK